MHYPDRETYRKLYARYLSENGRPVSELLNLANENMMGCRVLDLCGGAGELSLAARIRHADAVVMVDECPHMADNAALARAGIQVHQSEVQHWLFTPKPERWWFHLVFCRQAVNYWLNATSAKHLASNMHPGAKFIFNTFNRRPSTKPTVKQYEFGGARFMETSWLLEKTCEVRHIQCREGCEPHMTKFYWIPPNRFREWLGPYFEVHEHRDGATSIYTCTKKG